MLCAAPLRSAAKLLLTDEGERSAEPFVLDNRGLQNLSHKTIVSCDTPAPMGSVQILAGSSSGDPITVNLT